MVERCEIAARAGMAAGLGEEPLEPVSDAALRELGAARLWQTAAAAVAHRDIRSLTPMALQARIAFVHLTAAAGIFAREARETAEIPETTWARLAARAPSEAVTRAIRLQVALQVRALDGPVRSG